RREIKFQVALITPLVHVKGYAAPETKEAAERARLLIEQAGATGEPPEDPLLLFSVLYGFSIPGARPEASGNSATHDRASPNGSTFPHYWRRRTRPHPIRSGDCALRSR